MFVKVMRSYVEATYGKYFWGILNLGCLLVVLWLVFGVPIERVILMYLVGKFVWAGCLLLLVPSVELALWQGWYEKDIELNKGTSGLKPSSTKPNIAVAAIHFIASYAMSFLMLTPALILTLLFINNGDTICL